MTTPIEIIKTWKATPAIRNAFGTLDAYQQHMDSPESSHKKIFEKDGKIHVVANNDRKLSGTTALDIINKWKTDAAIRAEFKTFNAYRAFVEASTTGKVQIIGMAAAK